MIKEIKTVLEKKGINIILGQDDSLHFSTNNGYEGIYYEEERECLAFFDPSNLDAKLFGSLRFTLPGESEPKIKYSLLIPKGSTPNDVGEWIFKKIKNPERDPALMVEIEEFKSRVESLGLEWLGKDRCTHISPEFEELGKIKITSLAINFNDVVSDDHVLFQIKTLLDQPGEPKLYLVKTIDLAENSVSEEEFDPKDLEIILKRIIMIKYIDLGEQVSGQDESIIRKRMESL